MRMCGESSEEGSEIVSYVLVQVLVVFVFLIMMQFAFFVHTRNTAIAAACEGARRFSMLGGNVSDAKEQVDEVMNVLLGESQVSDLEVRREPRAAGQYEVGVVSFRTTFPVFLNFGPHWLAVSGSSVVEDSLP